MRLHVFLLIAVLLSLFETKAQDIDSIYQLAEQFYNQTNPTYESDQEAIRNYVSFIEIVVKEGDTKEESLRRADCHRKIGTIYHDRGDLHEALAWYHKSINIKSESDLPDSVLLEEFTLTGSVHFYLNNYDSAENYYRKAENISVKHDIASINVDLMRLFNALGALYKAVGNYNQAKNYFSKALLTLDSTERDYKRDRAGIRNNIATLYSRLNNNNAAVQIYNQILNSDVIFPALYLNLGKAFTEVQQYDSAEYYLRRSLNQGGLIITLDAYNNLADLFLKQGLLDSATLYFNRSISKNKDKDKSANLSIAGSYLGLAHIFSIYQKYDSTLYYYQRALINTTFDFNDSTVTVNPKDITQAISLLHLFEVLQGKAGAWTQYYQQDQDRVKLVHALETYQLAIRVAQHIQKTYDNDEAKLFLVNKVAPVYEEAIATAVQLYDLTQDPQYVAQAFQFSENSKAAVLAESLRDVKIKALGGVNDTLVQEEHRLKQQITALRLKLVESQDSAQNETYRQQLNDREIALARTIKYLQNDEHYYQRKYQPDTLNIAGLQRSLLSNDDALLEYFVGQEQVYLFLMTPDDLRVVSVDRTAELDLAWQRTRQQLYAFKPGQGDDEVSLATLYRFLIAPMAEAITDVNRLTIIPDGPLHYLPFDLLSVDGRRTHYLLQTHTLHYGYSASLLQQATDERRAFPTETVLAMAPFAGQVGGNNVRSQGFGLLRDSQVEVESIGGSIYTEGKATKRQFLKVAGSYNVLHLATHATVNSEDPSQSFIAFYPQQQDSVANYRLYTHELYNMRLDSVKLVVLSACEAGNGQLVRGEGVMSLARAFAYAGCPNIVTTLWKADDRSSAYLTSRMHRYLKEGWKKDEALRQAKLDYLGDESVQPSQKAPYYWAHFVFIGDPVPIYNDYRLWWWVGFGLLLLIAAGLLLMQRKKRVKEMA